MAGLEGVFALRISQIPSGISNQLLRISVVAYWLHLPHMMCPRHSYWTKRIHLNLAICRKISAAIKERFAVMDRTPCSATIRFLYSLSSNPVSSFTFISVRFDLRLVGFPHFQIMLPESLFNVILIATI